MIEPRRWITTLEDRSLDLQERLFRLLMTIGLCGMAAAIIHSIIAGDERNGILLRVIAFFVYAAVFYLSVRFHKVQFGAVIIGALLIYLELPYHFLTAGGIYGGSPIYLLFGMVYSCLVVEGIVKYVYLASSFIISAGCYYAVYSNPARFAQYAADRALADSIVSLMIVGALICGMILFQNSIFRSENATVKKQNREIEELNQTQNRFFSRMSHEIRTPVSTIIGLNEMILRKDVPNDVAADAMSMQSACEMLLALINDYLDMSKIESGRLDIVPAIYDVGSMLSDIVNMIWARAKDKGLGFHINVDREVPAQMYGDEVRVKQILINLLSNAVEHTESGSVTLSIQSKHEDEGHSDQVLITYSVTDTGTGIKKERIPTLFNTFQRANEESRLGLSIVKGLVELMGGEVTVNSVYTKGSTFVVTLPQKAIGEGKIGVVDLESKRLAGVRKHYKRSFEAPEAHVLIVDDDEANLMVAERLLADTKVHVDTAISGAKCLGKTLQKKYNVILMDHLMPGMSGIECTHAIRTQAGGANHDTPIVVLTANAGGEDQLLYRREGFNGYLPKPISSRQLEAELLKHLPRELVSMAGADDSVGVIEAPVFVNKKTLSVMISTDNVCDLPDDLIEKHQIAVMPFRLRTDGGEFLDGIEAEAGVVLSYMSEMGKDVRGVSPKVSDYEGFFAEQLTKAQYIVHITSAKHASEGYANSLEASRTFDNVTVVDSGHLSSGLGIMVLRAAELAESGKGVDDILQEIERVKKKIRTSFIVESTQYMVRSGRLSSKIHKICKVLMLHPVLVLRKSSITVGMVRIGSKEHVRKKYIASALRRMRESDRERLFITYAGLTREELEDIKEQVQSKVEFQNVIYQKASSAISTHCGPGTVGLFYMMK